MSSARLLASSLLVLTLLGLVSPLPAQDAALSKEGPGSLDELRALEKQVAKVLDKVVPCTVGVRVGNGQGSGVMVSADGYVLTAGHVSGEPGKDAVVILPSGKQLKAKTMGRNSGIDSGLIKISDAGPYPFVDMGKSADLTRGQWVVAVGHPGGFRPNRTPVVRLGRVLFVNPVVVRTDCALVGGDSGGPLFDLDGRVVGIHSRIGSGSITENLHVPVDTYRESWDRLVAAESWGGRLGQAPLVQSPGGKVVLDKRAELTNDDFIDKRRSGAHYKIFPFLMKAGSTYTIDLTSKFNGGLDPYLLLEEKGGKRLAEDDDGGGGTNARIVYRALRDAELNIIVTSCDPGQTGNFRLSVREADVKDPLVTGRVEVLKALHMPRQVAGVILEKLASGGVRLHLNAMLQDEAGKPATGQATFRWDSGELTVKADEQGNARLLLTRDRLKNLVLDLPESTRALLSLTDALGKPAGPRFGPDNDPGKEKVKSAGGSVVTEIAGNLTPGDPRDADKKQSYSKVHELKLTPGAAYTFDLVSDDFDAFLRLEDGSGKKLAEDDDSGGSLNARIVFRTTRDAAFRLVVLSAEPGQTGSYRLIVRRAEDPVK